MEEALNKSEQILEDAIEESDRKGELLEDLSDQNFKMCDEIQALKLKVINAENKSVAADKTKELLATENKKFKDEISDLKNAVLLANKDVKKLKREKNQLEHENIKTCEAFDSKLNKLKELNAEKMADEKHVKTKEKKISKKMKE